MGASRASTAAGRRRAATRRGAATPARPTPAAKAKAPVKKRPAARPPVKRGTVARRPAAHKRVARSTATPRRPRTRPAAPRLRIPRPRVSLGGAGRGLASVFGRLARLRVLVAIVLGLALLAGAYQLKLRDLPLFAVEDLSVTGLSGPEAGPAAAALEKAAAGMTTLHVDEAVLRASVAGFPTVVAVSADADFPHGLAIQVRERPPVLIAKQGERTLPVAGDGTVLPGVDVGEVALPVVEVEELPGSGALTGDGLEMALVAGAAPEPLRELIRGLAIDGENGVEVELKGGIPLRFGTGDRAADKWAAAASVLADPKIDTLTHIDLRVPERPAVGGAAAPPEDPLVP